MRVIRSFSFVQQSLFALIYFSNYSTYILTSFINNLYVDTYLIIMCLVSCIYIILLQENVCNVRPNLILLYFQSNLGRTALGFSPQPEAFSVFIIFT